MRPTEPGWYWYWEAPDAPPLMAEVWDWSEALMVFCPRRKDWDVLANYPGQFVGPFVPPERPKE